MKNVRKLLEFYAKGLRLASWKFDVVVDSGQHMPEGHLGMCNFNTCYETATIWLRDESTHPKQVADGGGTENTLIHELLHIVLNPLWHQVADDSLEYQLREQAIDRITNLVLETKYRGKNG